MERGWDLTILGVSTGSQGRPSRLMCVRDQHQDMVPGYLYTGQDGGCLEKVRYLCLLFQVADLAAQNVACQLPSQASSHPCWDRKGRCQTEEGLISEDGNPRLQSVQLGGVLPSCPGPFC